MPGIKFDYKKVQSHYSKQMDEIIQKWNNSKSKDKGQSPADLQWELRWSVRIPAPNFQDIFLSPQGDKEKETDSLVQVCGVSLSAKSKRFWANSSEITPIPQDIVDCYKQGEAEEKLKEQERDRSLAKANQDKSRLYLRLTSARDKKDIAVPIVAAYKKKNGKPIIVTKNQDFLDLDGYIFIDSLTVGWKFSQFHKKFESVLLKTTPGQSFKYKSSTIYKMTESEIATLIGNTIFKEIVSFD